MDRSVFLCSVVVLACIYQYAGAAPNSCSQFHPGYCAVCPSQLMKSPNNTHCYAFTDSTLYDKLNICPYSIFKDKTHYPQLYTKEEYSVLVQRLMDAQETAYLDLLSLRMGECPIWRNGTYTDVPCPKMRFKYPDDISCNTHCCNPKQFSNGTFKGFLGRSCML